jgi:DNA-binding transcriptional LysR family regulator
MNLRGIDLNLLVVFISLMEEGRVSRAADRIGMSQPAVSHALNRLRAYFNDPLFVRTPEGMKPTAKALEIAPQLQDALGQIDSILERMESFKPNEAHKAFTIGMSDYSGFVLLPRLLRTFQEQSPGSVLRVRAINRTTGPILLENAEIDLAIGIPADAVSLRRVELFSERWVAICCNSGPYADTTFTTETYAAAPHLNVSTHGEMTHHLDTAFSEMGLTRHVVASISHFLLAPLVIRKSGMVATVAERLALESVASGGLTMKELPFLDVDFRIEMLWHQNAHRSISNRWLRELVVHIASEI